MFHHSVRVPRLYKVAANIAKDVKEGVGSVKQLVYENKKKHPRIKALYALVATLFQKSDEIESLLKRSQFLIKEPRSNPWLIKVLIVELLWGSKRLPGQSTPEKTVLAYEQIFKAHVNDVSLAAKTNNSKAEIKPRYVRVNTLSLSLNEAVDGFRDEGWNLCKSQDKTNYKEFLNKITSLAEDEFLIDIHIPNLLIFPPKTEFYNHPAYKNGSLVLQDKASCLPVHILGPELGSIVLDMCAAPGMKTTQVAAVINNEGTIYAVERDPKRFETLNKIVDSSGATCVKTVNKDVLTCGGNNFPGVQYIIVDPSCTGSGMTDRLQSEQEQSQHRMGKLAGFQIKILRSALTRYPDAKRVVYSTCSIFPEENEDVVRQVLETNTRFKLVPANKFVNDTWQNFGSSDFGDIGKYCLYAKPNEDYTNGFFVAVFERLEEGEENLFFNAKIYNYKKHVQSQERRRSKKQQDAQHFGTGVVDYDEQFGDGVQQHQNHEIDLQHETIENTNHNINANIKRRKKKNDKNDFIENDDSACAKSSDNGEKKKKKKKCHNNEEHEETGIECNQIASNEGIRKKKKKNEPVAVEGYFFDKTENVEGQNKKKKREKSPNETFENYDENNFEPVKHKKKKKKNTKEQNESTESVTENNHKIDVLESSCEFYEISMKKEKRKEPHDEYLVNEGNDNVNVKKKKKKSRGDKDSFNESLEIVIHNNDEVGNEGDFGLSNVSKKRKKNKEPQEEHLEALNANGELIIHKKKKKKNNGNENADQPFSNEFTLMETDENGKKKKKKKKDKISDS